MPYFSQSFFQDVLWLLKALTELDFLGKCFIFWTILDFLLTYQSVVIHCLLSLAFLDNKN